MGIPSGGHWGCIEPRKTSQPINFRHAWSGFSQNWSTPLRFPRDSLCDWTSGSYQRTCWLGYKTQRRWKWTGWTHHWQRNWCINWYTVSRTKETYFWLELLHETSCCLELGWNIVNYSSKQFSSLNLLYKQMDRVRIVFTQMVSPFGLFPRLFSNAYYYYLVQSQPLIPPQCDFKKR